MYHIWQKFIKEDVKF